MAQPVSRTAETIFVLAVGFVLNLMAGVARAQPESVVAAHRLLESPALAGALGGLVGGMAHISAICLAPEPAQRRDVLRAVIEALFSIVAGAIAASYLTKQVSSFIPRIDVSDALSVGFAVGVFAWRAAPGLIGGIKLLTSAALIKEAVLRMLNAAPRSRDLP